MTVVTNAVRQIWRAAGVVTNPSQSGRREAVWIGLLALAQLADVVTTWVGLAHGNVEGNPQAANVLGVGGIVLLWLMKFSLVAAIAVVLLLSRRAMLQAERDGAEGLMVRLPHFVALRGTQAAVVVLSAISVNNILLTPLRPF